ncbi:hypothetical protein VPH35_081775 [Triticum aestivum]
MTPWIILQLPLFCSLGPVAGYMAETGGARCLHASLDVLASDVHSRLEFHKSAYTDYAGINNALHCVMEEKANLELQQNAVTEKDKLITEKDKLIAELKTRNEEQAAEIESLKEELEARESSHVLLALQGSGLQSSQSGRNKRTRESDGNGEVADEHGVMDNPDQDDQGLSTELENAKKELSDIHSKLIKGFMDISATSTRNIAIKNIGELSYKPFQQACLKKLPPEEASKKASEFYNFWQKQLLNPEWNPSKTVMEKGNPEEGISKEIDVHDADLLKLRAEWGEDVYKAVANCLVEIEKCGRLTDRTIIPVIWHQKADRTATRSESVEYMCSQVRRLRTRRN